MSAERTDIHALVAGVSLYVPGSPDDAVYPPLTGCAVDARAVAHYLHNDLGVPQEQIRLLTCSGDGPEPDEPEEHRPTYSRLVAALKDLATQASTGDQVLFYFTGHGTRVPTLIPEVKGYDELDECLVPSDAGTGGRLLRDVEIAALATQLADRKIYVTFFLDCCHSGGALKAPEDEVAVRGVSFVDEVSRPTGSEVASREELAAVWQRSAGRPAPGTVLLAACRPGERALEVLLEGRKRGLFTWALLDALKRLGTGVGYRRLHERVLARVHTLFEIQTPFLDGSSERTVLGGEPRRPLPAVTVLAVNPDQQNVQLAAGAPYGIGAGARFAIYPLQAEDLSQTRERVALVEVIEAGATNSRARVTQILRPQVPLETGAPAVLLGSEGASTRSRVARLEGASSRLIEAVAAQLAQSEDSGFVELAGAGDLPDFRLAAADGDVVEILDGAGQRLTSLAAPSGPEVVLASLEHLARYRSLQLLANLDPASDLAEALSVSLDRLARPWQSGQPLEIVPLKQRPPTVRPGDWLCLTIENRTNRELNIVVLDLQADWSISQSYPAGAFLPLDGRNREHIPFQVTWPFHQRRGRDHLKIFAVVGTVDFRFLQLPALGEPLQPSSPYRALVPERYPQHSWTVVDLIYEVAR